MERDLGDCSNTTVWDKRMNLNCEAIEGLTQSLTDYLDFSEDMVSLANVAFMLSSTGRELPSGRDKEAAGTAQQEVKHCARGAAYPRIHQGRLWCW